MRRGRIFIYLALIIIVALVGGFFYFKPKLGAGSQKGATATPQYVNVVSAAQSIAPGTQITEAMLSYLQLSEADANANQDLFRDPSLVVGMYAKVFINQRAPIIATELATSAGNINLPGSSWASYIPQGLTAVSIPVTRLSSAAFGVRDGDYVNVIASLLLLDIDPETQTVLPFMVAGVKIENGGLTITPADILQGHFQPDEVANALGYLYPAENQRPRMVTQMIMQNIQVLHVGSFPLPGEANSDQLNPQASEAAAAEAAATPAPSQGEAQAAVPAVVKPDVITLMVTPQDAVTLTYLVYTNAQINLTLRNPNDQDTSAQPDAAMLEYLLTQYNIPVPAKLPYSLNPRSDALKQPTLSNDNPVP